mmetsp:Transcript_21052/g.53876  ORF Transcript_21052/g.53876 Transcript_21052/m.53876 type:complete len:251 (-) Transcript_21052:604-1356(-)
MRGPLERSSRQPSRRGFRRMPHQSTLRLKRPLRYPRRPRRPRLPRRLRHPSTRCQPTLARVKGGACCCTHAVRRAAARWSRRWWMRVTTSQYSSTTQTSTPARSMRSARRRTSATPRCSASTLSTSTATLTNGTAERRAWSSAQSAAHAAACASMCAARHSECTHHPHLSVMAATAHLASRMPPTRTTTALQASLPSPLLSSVALSPFGDSSETRGCRCDSSGQPCMRTSMALTHSRRQTRRAAGKTKRR